MSADGQPQGISVGTHLRELIVVAGLIVGPATLGYIIGAGKNDSFVENLKDDKQDLQTTVQALQEDITRLTTENSRFKVELASGPGELQVAQVEQSGTAPGGTSIQPPSDNQPPSKGDASDELPPPVSPKVIIATVPRSTTVTLFDGELHISLIGTDYTGTPLRSKAYFSIGSPGKATKTVESADVGFLEIYEGFEVRVTSVETFEFTVRAERSAK